MNHKYIFDLDNTLIYTNMLNNKSYNYAIRQYGLSTIDNKIRITRDMISTYYPHLSQKNHAEIIKIKQEYFIRNMHYTIKNKFLFDILQSKSRSDCVLWTSSDRERAKKLIEYYNIHNHFKYIIHSDKSYIINDVMKICNTLDCDKSHLIFFEDDDVIVTNLKLLDIFVYKIY